MIEKKLKIQRKNLFFALNFCFIFFYTFCENKKNSEDKSISTYKIIPELSFFSNLNINLIDTISINNEIVKSKKVFKTDQFYNTKNWLKNLGFSKSKKQIIVNASNDTITFGGGGTNGALKEYQKIVYPECDDWKNITDSKGNKITSENRHLEVGNFAISDTPFGKIFHFSGPKLKEDLPKLSLGVYKMLLNAENEEYTKIVIPAISTGIYSLIGVYNGIIKGVEKFLKDYPNCKIKIYLNKFEQDKQNIGSCFENIPSLK